MRVLMHVPPVLHLYCTCTVQDIMIPTSQSICGPLCGYTRERLLEQSM